MGLLLAACGTPTDVDPLTVALRFVSFATQEEWSAWPTSPTIEGGETLVIRGTAFPGCRMIEAHAQRRDDVVGVEIRVVGPDRMCLAVIHSSPFETTVSGLAPGTYRVRVGVAGVSGRAQGAVTIVAP